MTEASVGGDERARGFFPGHEGRGEGEVVTAPEALLRREVLSLRADEADVVEGEAEPAGASHGGAHGLHQGPGLELKIGLAGVGDAHSVDLRPLLQDAIFAFLGAGVGRVDVADADDDAGDEPLGQRPIGTDISEPTTRLASPGTRAASSVVRNARSMAVRQSVSDNGARSGCEAIFSPGASRVPGYARREAHLRRSC